jgi:hypothetical protein
MVAQYIEFLKKIDVEYDERYVFKQQATRGFNPLSSRWNRRHSPSLTGRHKRTVVMFLPTYCP